MTDILTILGSGLIAFLVAWATVRAEESKGRAILYSLCCRYFIATIHLFSKTNGEFLNDPHEKKMYVAELVEVLKELSAVSANPFFVRFVSKYELAPKMIVQIRREIFEHHKNNSTGPNIGTMEHFVETYDWCKKPPWGIWLKKHSNTEELVGVLRIFLENSRQQQK